MARGRTMREALLEQRLTHSNLAGGHLERKRPIGSVAFAGKSAGAIIGDWRNAGLFSTEKSSIKKPGKPKIPAAGSYFYKLGDAEAEVISKPKKGFERRFLHITHPLPQALLAYEIAENWRSVAGWIGRQQFSLDRPDISKKFDRGIDRIGFPAHQAKKAFIEATSDWLVTTDISRFYPTIYTHSIAWAAYGKERVKSDMKVYDGSLADRIDALVRTCNRKQTIGIPIGPETSRIIADIISARIDFEFEKARPTSSFAKIDRLQDDWFVGTSTLQEAEQALATISACYRAFGLEINGSKTSIDRMVVASGDSWPSELGAFLAHTSKPLQGSRMREFLALGLRLQASNPTDPVISYVLSVVERRNIRPDDVEVLESFLLKGAVLSPLAMDKICRVVINMARHTARLSIERIVERFTTLAETNLEVGNTFEVMWLIHTIRGLRRVLKSKRIAELMETHAGSVLPIILLDMKNNSLFPAKLPKDRWETQANLDRSLSDWSWLVSYEGIRHGWLSDRHAIMSGAFFKPMMDRGIEFYDPKKNVASSRKAARARSARNRVDMHRVFLLINSLRGFRPKDFSDY